MEKTCKEAIIHLEKVIDLVKEQPNDLSLGSKIRDYINTIDDEQRKSSNN